MDVKLIQRLIKLMKDGEVFELELEDEKAGSRLRLKRGRPEAPAVPMPMVHVMHAGAAPVPQVAAPGAAPAAPSAPEAQKPAAHKGTTISSPMVGTFYRSSSPEAEAFVRVGSRVELDRTLCIIEAMKVMNEIKSEISGEILEILVENGEPVEFGQPLFLVKTD
ncbi:MAG: acetyl-CoA carboxylase biotin carboxyl carrier protein [Planctomycetes bacterium]|nr:acetyl-CoA carboxylase biotin carboxyl carrier protein [Planctomycetota bacterium]